MKRLTVLLAFFSFFSFGVKSQNLNQVSVRLSYNQFELGYQRTFIQQKLWGEAFIGLGNQDINNKYDDYVTGVRIGTPVFSNNKNVIHIAASVGVYVPNNTCYSTVTPYYGGIIGYSRFIGKTQKHSLLINLGYQYGKGYYKQEYSSNDISIATTGSFKVSPIHFSAGYGFLF